MTANSVSNTSSKNMCESFQLCDICSGTSRFCSCMKCENCKSPLKVPYIECTKCVDVNLCCKCFSAGSEFGSHESDHNYRVVKQDFILFDGSDWSAAEELDLLEVLSSYGYGNWELVASKISNRTIQEVKEHYDRFYIDKPASELLPKVKETQQSLFPQPIIPYQFKLFGVDEPPRYSPGTLGYELIAGYNAARSDFEVEFDDNAEHILSNLSDLDIERSDPLYNIFTDLQCAIVLRYNRRLKERQLRKEIIREHGMIVMQKNMSWMHRYDKTITRRRMERLLTFMRYFTGDGFVLFMEGLHRTAELKQRIARLQGYRWKGIKTLQAAEVYEEINQEKEHGEKDLSLFISNPLFNWKCLDKLAMKSTQNVPNKRSQFRPLDIVDLPGYNKLSKKEQDLCTNTRLVPQAYLELKELLMNENRKFGYLKLQTARRMLKIDVNKTRKLYDFLLKEGFVAKPTE